MQKKKREFNLNNDELDMLLFQSVSRNSMMKQPTDLISWVPSLL